MADESIFSLKKPAGPKRAEPKRTWTPEEQEEKLAGYFEIKRDHWALVKHGAYIRFYDTEGAFNGGGAVSSNPGEKDGEQAFILTINPFASTATKWSVAYSAVERLFVKCNGVEMTLVEEMKAMAASTNANLSKIREFLVVLDKRLKDLEKR